MLSSYYGTWADHRFKSLSVSCNLSSRQKRDIPKDGLSVYADAVMREFDIFNERYGGIFGSNAGSLYFGGGTPSLMSSDFFERIIGYINKNFSLSSGAEITVEINPESGDYAKFRVLKDIGVNRISVGAQSFNDEVLKFAGRVHTGRDIFKCYENARKAGFDNISLDIITGLPKQSLDILNSDLTAVKSLDPEHISAYMLSIESGTVFYDQLKKLVEFNPPEKTPDINCNINENECIDGDCSNFYRRNSIRISNVGNSNSFDKNLRDGNLPDDKFNDDDKMAEYFVRCAEFLTGNGYDHYEISNFAKKERQSRHNLTYWQRGEYIGLGPSAASFLRLNPDAEIRKTNIADLELYLDKISNYEEPAEYIETLTKEDKIEEEIFLSLRTGFGIKEKRLAEIVRQGVVEDLIKNGFLSLSDNNNDSSNLEADPLRKKNYIPICQGRNIILTLKGMMVSNEIFVKLLK